MLRAELPAVAFVLLDGTQAVVAERLRRRTGHFMPAELLPSQYALLEQPAPDELACICDIDAPVDVVVGAAMDNLARLELANILARLELA